MSDNPQTNVDASEHPIAPFLRMDRMPHMWCPGCGHGGGVVVEQWSDNSGLRVVDLGVEMRDVAIEAASGEMYAKAITVPTRLPSSHGKSGCSGPNPPPTSASWSNSVTMRSGFRQKGSKFVRTRT